MDENPQEAYQMSFTEEVYGTTYHVEIITHKDLRHYFYLNGAKTDCFIERSIGEADMYRVRQDLNNMGDIVDYMRYGLSRYNKNIITTIIHKYAAEYFI